MRRFLLILNLVACTRATPDATPSAPTNVASAALIDDAGVDAEAAELEAEASAMQIRMLEALGDASNIGSSDLKIRANGPISGGTGLAGLGGQKDAGPTPWVASRWER